jgi:hypothetical protein
MKFAKQVFILGAPRSGTTFLASLLKSTRYGAPFETHFIPKYYERLVHYGDINKFDNFKKILSDILRERAVMQWRLDLDPKEFFESFQGNVSYPKLVDRLCALKPDNGNTGFWGEKTPWYLDCFDLIHTLFPDAKYIHIVRDGRDVALSLLDKEWGPNNIYACAEYWQRLNRYQPTFEELRRKNQLISLKYEDLLQTPEKHVRNLYDFLDEAYEPGKVEQLINTTKKDNCFKWKTRLTSRQSRLFDSVAGEALARLGYEVAENVKPPPAIIRLLYQLHNKSIWLTFMFKTNVIDGFRIKFMNKQPFAD